MLNGSLIGSMNCDSSDVYRKGIELYCELVALEHLVCLFVCLFVCLQTELSVTNLLWKKAEECAMESSPFFFSSHHHGNQFFFPQ